LNHLIPWITRSPLCTRPILTNAWTPLHEATSAGGSTSAGLMLVYETGLHPVSCWHFFLVCFYLWYHAIPANDLRQLAESSDVTLVEHLPLRERARERDVALDARSRARDGQSQRKISETTLETWM
jgi:hypothetical protein